MLAQKGNGRWPRVKFESFLQDNSSLESRLVFDLLCPPWRKVRSMLPNRNNRTNDSDPTGSAQYAGVGMQFALTFMVFGAFGYWLDEKWNTQPWFLIIGVFVGATGAFISLVRKFPISRPRHEDETED